MIEEVIMVRDAFNSQEFDAVSTTHSSNNSDAIGNILTAVLIAGCSMILYIMIQNEIEKSEKD